jgi:hypothetical protein
MMPCLRPSQCGNQKATKEWIQRRTGRRIAETDIRLECAKGWLY